MATEFEFQDMSDAVFWGVDLRRATFRDVDLSAVRISHARMVGVDIDALIDRLVVNGVDVTQYVNERDPWSALRSWLLPTDGATARQGWQALVAAWGDVIDRGRRLSDEQRHASVDGEWSLVQTIRHLVFATDKWFTVPIGGGGFHPIGLPNSGSADVPWPGIDRSASPGFEEAVTAWHDRADRLRTHLDDLPASALADVVEVLENGPTEVQECIAVVLDEHFHHLRYAVRDLDRLAGSSPGRSDGS